MNWGFTGTRQGMTERQKEALAYLFHTSDHLIHGDAIGADAEAHALAQHMMFIEIWPSNIEDQRAFSERNDPDDWYPTKVQAPMSPLERNQYIARTCDILIAAPRSLIEEQRSGTWATIRYARKIGKPVIILDP